MTHIKQESWEAKICTCRKEWLDDEMHYANCPVFVVTEVIAAERQAAAVEEREAISQFIIGCADTYGGDRLLMTLHDFLRARSRQPNQ